MHGCSQGVCVVAPGGVWLLLGGMHGCSRGGVCGCFGGHAWLLLGGIHGCSQGGCMVAPGGTCVVTPRGHAWLLRGGHTWDTMRYGDTINEQVVCILLECILVSVVSSFVSHSVHSGGPHVTITHDALDLTVQCPAPVHGTP